MIDFGVSGLRMSLEALLAEYDIFDNAILSHGFTDYNRDYLIVAELGYGGGPKGTYNLLFRGCVEAHYQSAIPREGWSLNDVLLDYDQWQAAEQSDGYVWAVCYADAYPGWKLVVPSERAERWGQELGIAMRELLIETNVFRLQLVFHDLTVSRISNNPTSSTAPD